MSFDLDWLAFGPLSGHGVLMLVFTLAVFAAFVTDRLQIGTVCLAVLILLPALFFVFPMQGVEPYRFFGGFGHPALVAICSLMILGRSLVLTGALDPAARQLAWLVARAPWLALLVVLVGAAAMSGFVNDTPLVVLLIPLLATALRRAGRAPAFMLMPMNHAVLIGGMATTIGTSTNVIVVSLAVALGVPMLGMFDFYPLVAVAALPALAYLWLVAPWLLRDVAPAQPAQAQPVFDAELRVVDGSPLVGATVRAVLRRAGGRLPLRQIRRADGTLAAPLPALVLRAGDRLVLCDTVEHLKEAEARLGAPLHDFDAAAPAGDAAPTLDLVAAQLVVTPQSPLVGRTVRGERLQEKYQLTLIGLRKARDSAERQPRENLADVRVEPGDVLLLQGHADAMRLLQRDGVALMLDERLALPRRRKSPVALLTLAGVVLAAGVGGMPIALAAMVGVLVLLVTRTLAWQEIGSALSVNVVLLVAASLALGDALGVTGGTTFLAHALVAVVDAMPPAWALAALMGLMGLLTNFVSNNAAAAVGTPLAVEVARALGVPPEPFVLAVLFGCNLCYVTPMAYQTNLLVMNVAGYTFRDFVRVGAPLFVLMWVALSVLLARHYGL
ncbi:MAG TPA: SLC13 family permease [Rubrivivax sp.]|nr:hypothetical protein [Burkholderiaceae bacterium]HMQ72294.1 SLC13 family permease [Rubrivivax sp.]HMR69670.1 SLC13 family permease [Rubrivivax sp.]